MFDSMHKEQDVYIRPRRAYTIKTTHGFIRESLEKRIGEVISLVPEVHDPKDYSSIMNDLKRKLVDSGPDDVLICAVSANEWPFMMEAIMFLNDLHGHVNYLYYEPVWGTLVEGRAV